MALEIQNEFFEAIPVGVFRQDFTEVKKAMDDVGIDGIPEMVKWINTHPKEVYSWLPLIKIIDFNSEIVKIFEGKDKQDILDNRHKIRSEAMLDGFSHSLKVWLTGQQSCTYEGIAHTLKGNRVKLKFNAKMVRAKDWSLIYFACFNYADADDNQLRMEEAKFELIATLREFAT